LAEVVLGALRQSLDRSLEVLTFADNMYLSEQFFLESIQSGFSGWFDPGQVESQLDFILLHCALEPPARVLDMATGHGRYAFALAERGFEVVGTDISPVLIDHLNQSFANDRLHFALASFNQLNVLQEFDLVLILGNSLSLVPADEAQDTLARVQRSLRPGGQLFLQLDNRPYYIAREAGSRTWVLTPGKELLLSAHIYDPVLHLEKTLDTSLDLHSGEIRQYPLVKRLFTCQEIIEELDTAGIQPLAAFGDWDASPVTEHSPCLLSISRQRADDGRPMTEDR
jgi:SAM-dependent methyltransferase